MSGQAGESGEQLSQGTVGRRVVAGKVETPVHSADGREVVADALGSLEAASDPQPHGVQTQIFTCNRQSLDVGEEAEFREGLLLGVEGLARTGRPGVTLEQSGVELELLAKRT